MRKLSKGKKSENLGKGMVTLVQITFIVDRYLCDSNYLAAKSLLSVMNTYNADGSPAISAPSAVAL